jgi:protein-ribulosamine 3-kinase
LSLHPLAGRLAAGIARATGEAFTATEASPVGGGCIHEALRLEGRTGKATRTLFAKVNEASKGGLFESEADGLAALRQAGAVKVPGVVAQGADDEHAWLVLEWLDLSPLDAASAARLGRALAAQHRLPHERFGWRRDNHIGATPQSNTESDDWQAFFRDRRLHAQLRLAARNRLPSRLIDRGERLLADCAAFFSSYRPVPSLLHGDLWGGNAAALHDGTPVIFDPAVYVGDREADVAMTELFGGFPRDFLAAYREAWPLDGGYATRRELYNLYHLLNHANLFFGDYVRRSEDTIGRLLAEIS